MFDNQRNDLPQRNPFLDIEAAVDEREGHEEDDSDEEDHLFLASEEESLDEENGFDHRLFVNISGFIPERKSTEDDSVWDELLVRARRRANISKTLQWQVHHDDSPSLDQPDATSSQSTSQVWVRIRPSSGFLKKYKGDIALATSTPDPKEVKYCLVPRLRGKRQLAPERGGQCPVKGAEYSDDGFLIVLASPKIAVSWSGQVLPTKHEYLDFKGSTTLTGQLRKETERRLEQNTQVEVGHRVKFVTGSFVGLTGIVLGIATYTLEIAIPSLDISVEVLPYEIRKEIIPGDRLMVISGDHVGIKGWAIGVAGNIVSIFVRGDSAVDVDSVHGSDREIDINSMDVTFYEEFQNTNLRDLSSSKSHLTYSEIAEEKRQMRKNPNDIFVGKEVMVTGANEYKGITGIIKDTSLDGQASVALNLFSQPKPVYIPLKLLRLQYTSTFDEGGRRTVLQPLIWDEHAKTAVINRYPLPSLPPPREKTRPPDNPETTTPAWGPFPNPPAAASHTPALPALGLLINTSPESSNRPPLWLGHPKFQRLRVKLYQPDSPDSILEFRRFNGDTVTVRECRSFRQIPLEDVAPVLVRKKEEIVVCFEESEYFGELFRIKTYGLEHCVVRKFGKKAGKGEKLWTLATSFLAEVYPGFRS